MTQTTLHDTGFLVLHMGGTGALAARPLRELHEANGRPFPLFQVLIDSDQANNRLREDGIVDAVLPVRLDYDEIETVKATPWSFGPIVPRIVEHVAPMLDPEELEHGARTVRPCAQLLWEVRRDFIADKFSHCVRTFRRQSGCTKIIPIAACSIGGGTGSTYSILLGASLQEESFRRRALLGFPPDHSLLRTPDIFAVDPFFRAFDNADDPNHAAKIMANAFAWRIESEYLERRRAFSSIFHFGLSGPRGGGVLDVEREVARVLGTCLFQYLKHWTSHIKPLRANRPPLARYRGYDTPEYVRQRLQAAAAAPTGNGQHLILDCHFPFRPARGAGLPSPSPETTP